MSAGRAYKDKEELYRLIISQLLYDGYQREALTLIETIRPLPECPPSSRLLTVYQKGNEIDKEERDARQVFSGNSCTGIDLEYESDVTLTSPDASHYETVYVTSHKEASKCSAFSPDGLFVATGSVDASIKLLDVEKMVAKAASAANAVQDLPEQHPVVKTYYDHVEEVTCVDFHPTDTYLASGSRDKTIRIYDYSKTASKKAIRTIEDVEIVKALSYHPCGDYIQVACKHPILRLYNLETSSCFVSPNPREQHIRPISCVKYASNGSYYATGSKDGSIKIWDGVSSRCVMTFDNAHSGETITSLEFSRNSKYLLSAGKDSLVNLWELSAGRKILVYTGAGLHKMTKRVQAVFNHTEDYVLFPDEGTTSLCCWGSRNGQRMKLLALLHSRPVRSIVHSPNQAAFVTCSEDFRARFWYKKPEAP